MKQSVNKNDLTNLSITDVLESNFDMIDEQENRDNLGWIFITDSWALIVS